MLHRALIDSLKQIEDVLAALSAQPESRAVDLYVDTRVGSHVRHVLDHYLAFVRLDDGELVNYNIRNRESPVEVDIDCALEQLEEVRERLELMAFADRAVQVISEIDCAETRVAKIPSGLHREALWMINHTVHHAALIKLLLSGQGIELDDYIGLAPATASYERGA